MSRRLLFLLAACAVSGAACTGGDDDDDDGASTPLTADLTGAVAVALREPSAVSAALGAAATPTPPACGQPDLEFVKVAADGTVTPVLNAPFLADHVEQSDSNFLVRGLGYVTNSAGDAQFWCCMLGVPKSSGPVRCLSRHGVGNADPGVADGIVTRDDEVLYTRFDLDAGFHQLVQWDGSSATQDFLLQLAATPLLQPFAAPGIANACVLAGDELLCANIDAVTPSWQPLTLNSGGTVQSAVQVGTHIFASNSSVALLDLSEVFVLSGFGQLDPGKRVVTTSGGLIAVNGDAIIHLAEPATIEFLHVAPATIDHFIGANAFAYFFGGGELRSIDLGTLVVSTNLLATVQMLEVTGMAFTTEDRIRLDGTDSGGQPTTVLVDTVTGEITSAPGDVPTFSTVEVVQ